MEVANIIHERNDSENITCGVKAKILSWSAYSLLVLRIPTSLDLRPVSSSFSFLPIKKKKTHYYYIILKGNISSQIFLFFIIINGNKYKVNKGCICGEGQKQGAILKGFNFHFCINEIRSLSLSWIRM